MVAKKENASTVKEEASTVTQKPSFWARFKADIIRYGTAIPLICVLFLPFSSNVNWLSEMEANLRIVALMSGFGISVSLITHVTRRILFPYLDLKQYAEKALEDPRSAGMVFLGICIIIAVSIFASAGFFK